MDKQIQVIKAENPYFFSDKLTETTTKIKRVGAYCRVSTDSEEQLNSYEQQLDEWTKRINENPNYKLIKIYADAGISGTTAVHRNGFNEMLRDARNGKLDLILTKSISRFARNTVLTINTVRELKELGVEVYFDNERMSSFDPKNEFMFHIMSSMAQEESRHISENVKWTFQKMMKEGKPFVNCSRFLGYDKDSKGNLIVNQEEAKIVKLIFDLYDNGIGPAEINRRLKEKGYKTAAGSTDWCTTTIDGILRNEKYKGDLLLQKTVTVDYLTHKAVKNKGQAQQYYITNDHEPIIDREQWDRVQKILKQHAEKRLGARRDLNKYNTRYPLSGMMICVHCGNTYKRRTWTQGYITPKHMFQCNGYIQTLPRCEAKPLSENLMLTATAQIINDLYLSQASVFKNLYSIIVKNLSNINVDKELDTLLDQKTTIEQKLDFIFNQLSIVNEPELKGVLNEQYQKAMNEYRAIVERTKDLQQRKSKNDNSTSRLNQIYELLKDQRLTPKMITKEIMDAFIYRIIITGPKEAVFVINSTNTVSLEQLREQRKEVAELEPIHQTTVEIRDPIKLMSINCKVVTI